MASNGKIAEGKIIDASSVDFPSRNGTRTSQFDPLLPYVQKMKPGKAFCATAAADAPRLKTLQNQLCAWVRSREEKGLIDADLALAVRRDRDGQLWLVAAE